MSRDYDAERHRERMRAEGLTDDGYPICRDTVERSYCDFCEQWQPAEEVGSRQDPTATDGRLAACDSCREKWSY